MIENPDGIIEGTKIIMELTKIKKAFIGIESNKPEAIKILKDKVKNIDKIEVLELKSIYPQGAEKQLIYMTTGKKVPAGGLPSDIGVLVQNINTVSFIHNYVKTGVPLIKKRVTVDGSCVNTPKNLDVLIGTTLKDVFEYCGGFSEKPFKIIMGGPMMGVSQFSTNTSVVKHTNALLAFNKKDSLIPKEEDCLRCGKCVDACPMNLLPLYINMNVYLGNIDETKKYKVFDCIECGCCSYICPSYRNLVQSIRYAKDYLKNNNKN